MSWLLVPSLLLRVSSCPASLVDSQLWQSWPLSLSSATCLWFWQASSVHLAPRPPPNATDTCVFLLSLLFLLLLLFVELPCLVGRWGWCWAADSVSAVSQWGQPKPIVSMTNGATTDILFVCWRCLLLLILGHNMAAPSPHPQWTGVSRSILCLLWWCPEIIDKYLLKCSAELCASSFGAATLDFCQYSHWGREGKASAKHDWFMAGLSPNPIAHSTSK